ncbi:MAG: HNH endonuclease [Alphaproteobacteria bacterium]|nr:HNH endonuclease [Alphaproteobacteria bacterium]
MRNHKENKSDKIVLTDFDPDLYIDGIIKEKLISLKLRNQKLVLERKEKDNFTCQACGFYYNNKIVECHHLVPLSDSKLTYNSIDDLITLCPNCHALAHSFLYIDDIYQKRELLLKKIKEVIQNM